MDYSTRGGPAHNANPAPNPSAHHPVKRKRIDWAARTVRIELFILLLGCALLLAAVSLYLGFSGSVTSEFDRVDTTKYQAVFLNGGIEFTTVTGTPIAYFGHITKLNDKYYVLNDVYYLTKPQASAANQSNVELTKLGCQQLHSPYDEMVINRSQVAFWENIKDNGKVAQAIKQFQKQYPNGPNCSAPTNSSSTQAPASNKQP